MKFKVQTMILIPPVEARKRTNERARLDIEYVDKKFSQNFRTVFSRGGL